ncbi:thioredoxin-dependent peroxidase [Reticulomyxa filosa]|uniref:thioredoxin-dependent peroxiredoxin n=1 Tax=Reticulomyxa filosa TaxID=46433 RepID=X6NQJ7_RETFI|nr:thioredoxin-dependent peroxidase [Reticulomyxa filosa]|eukprot:ETO28565.1 thioredoxin-dependent peroxidase [Reticulomyxa filosa]
MSSIFSSRLWSRCTAAATRTFVQKRHLQIQQLAPSFSATAVIDKKFSTIKLQDYKGKYLVLFFYPLDFTFVCPTEIIEFSDRVKEFKELDCEVIGASIDSHFSHLAWIETPREKGGLGEMNIPLLADITGKISKDYDCMSDEGFTVRATYIIDSKGKVRHISLTDTSVGRSVDEVLRLVEAFQYTDHYGEVCPAGWKEGGKTVILFNFKLFYFKRQSLLKLMFSVENLNFVTFSLNQTFVIMKTIHAIF